jgi:ferric-dicitrate binding protein FerR (iron transport regulator)
MMNVKTKQDHTVDLSWERLHSRLEQDNLLPSPKTSYRTALFRSREFRWAASIALLCVSLLTVLLRNQLLYSPASASLVLHNELNAPTLATTLEDGSVVYLSEMTTIQYPEHFQADKREVMLTGNAFFEISKQQGRPFVVDTKTAEIEVLGTFFQVESDDKSSFRLAVRNGEVKVTLKKTNQIIYVKAGETASLESGLLQLSKNEWNPMNEYFDKIYFKDERLSDIVRIINNNSMDMPIEIAADTGDRRLNFDYSGETPEEVAQLICMALNLSYIQHQNSILIQK